MAAAHRAVVRAGRFTPAWPVVCACMLSSLQVDGSTVGGRRARHIGAAPGIWLGASPEAGGAGECEHQGMACSVLIVDDHPGFRAQARVLLAAAGYRVVGEAADGESAVRAARDLSPDVILLDVQLPDISGFEVVRRLHGQPGSALV